MYQNLHKQLVTSNRQTRQTSKHKFLGKVDVFSLIQIRLTCTKNQERAFNLLNPFTKIQGFLNITRNLQELVTIHGRKK